MSRPVFKLGKENRHVCSKCGSVRNEMFTTPAYRWDIIKQYTLFWHSMPQVNSHICKFHLAEFGLDK